jgi:ABC-type lipoprotein export system ATPase subunit
LHTGDVVAKLRRSCREHDCTLVVVSHEREVVEAFDRQVAFLELNRAFARKEVVV